MATKRKSTRKKWKPTAKQLAMAKAKGGIVLRRAKQTGSSNFKADGKRKAMAPGKRLSRNGNVYYESRKNRSDRRPSRKR